MVIFCLMVMLKPSLFFLFVLPPLPLNALSIESLGSSPSLKQTGVPFTVLQLQSSASFNLPHLWQVSSFFLVYDK
jgi:hypothetical protein